MKVSELYKGVMSREEARMFLPLGFAPGMPIVSVKNGKPAVTIPFLRYKLTGAVDGTLVFPVKYLMDFSMPSGKLLAFRDLANDPSFSDVDFNVSNGTFRHPAARHLDRKAFMALKDETLGLYDALAEALAGESGADAEELKARIARNLPVLIEPATAALYARIDPEFGKLYDSAAALQPKPETGGEPQPRAASGEQPAGAEPPRKVALNPELLNKVALAAGKLNECGMGELAGEMQHLLHTAISKSFTVAFVGEFSRGKSTLVNSLLGADILPSANLPTTALLTDIVYGPVAKLTYYGADGKAARELPLDSNAWKGLTAHLEGDDPKGHVKVEYPSPWLKATGIRFIDTPGAGDLEEKRSAQVERALVGSDGAIIVVDATKALSQTEQLFIRRKITSRAVPFMAMALTKLDLVPENERAQVENYVKSRLNHLKLSMPVFRSTDREGILHIMEAWMANGERRALTERWLRVNAGAIVESAKALLRQQQEIVDAKDMEKEKLIGQREKALAEVHPHWEELRTEMQRRCADTVRAFDKAAREAGDVMLETLRHEADRQPNPKEWLERDYSYRVKRELSAISLSLDNLVAKRLTADVQWLNGRLSKQFKELTGPVSTQLEAKEDFLPNVDDKALRLGDLKDKSLKNTIVSSALTLGAALMLGVSGGAPLILATMGVGTGANILSRRNLEKEAAKQKEAIARMLDEQIPLVIKEASADSATKIKILYHDVISETHNTENRWIRSQKKLIRESVAKKDDAAFKKLVAERMAAIDNIKF